MHNDISDFKLRKKELAAVSHGLNIEHVIW
jgi:hypothetical protein